MLDRWEIWTGWGLAGVGLAVVLAAFLRRGRGRCRRCGYAMEGVPAGRCPECGREHTARDLRRGYRPKRWVVVGLALAAAGMYLGPVAERRAEGWRAFAPTLGVVLAMPREWGPPGAAQEFRGWCWKLLAQRNHAGRLPAWQHRILCERFVRLDEETVWGAVRVPRAWVKGEPIPVRIDWGFDLSGGLLNERLEVSAPGRPMRLSASSPTDGLTPYISNFNPGRQAREGLLPARDARSTEFVLEASARVTPADDSEFPFRRERTYRRTFTIPLVETFEEAVAGAVTTPVRDPEVDAWLRDRFGFRVGANAYGNFIVYSSGKVYDDENPFEDLCFVFDAEVWDGDTRVWRATVRADTIGEHYPTSEERGALEALIWDPSTGTADGGTLVLRLVPRPDVALHELAYGRYWAGEIKVPLAEVLRVE